MSDQELEKEGFEFYQSLPDELKTIGYTCKHDYANSIRQGRSSYTCPICGEDISLGFQFYMESIIERKVEK